MRSRRNQLAALGVILAVVLVFLVNLMLYPPPTDVDINYALVAAQQGKITEIDVSDTTMTLTTNDGGKFRVLNVSQDQVDTVVSNARASNPASLRISITLAPDPAVTWRILASTIPLILLVLAIAYFFRLMRRRRI